MSKVLELRRPTDPRWARIVCDDFDAFLADHANCERKASAQAMSFLVKFPDRTRILKALILLAQEELEHFGQVYALMESRGVALAGDSRGEYVRRLLAGLRHGRDERFQDRLLLAAVVERRGAERFGIVADAVADPELHGFYADLARSEIRHSTTYVKLALHYFDEAALSRRLEELLVLEADIVSGLEPDAALY